MRPKAQAGAMLDYLYSKGSYANQAVKDLNWGFSGSYLGDRYEFQGFYYHYNLPYLWNPSSSDTPNVLLRVQYVDLSWVRSGFR